MEPPKYDPELIEFWARYGNTWDPCERGGPECIMPAITYVGEGAASCGYHAVNEISRSGLEWTFYGCND